MYFLICTCVPVQVRTLEGSFLSTGFQALNKPAEATETKAIGAVLIYFGLDQMWL